MNASHIVSVQEVEDIWKNKWGKEVSTTRIALSYKYNPAFNAALKGALQFPQLKFTGATKQWSITNAEEVLDKAVDALREVGADFDESLPKLRGETKFVTLSVKVTAATAVLQGSAVVLQWPYIADPATRTTLMNQVKASQGRKYNPDTKTWSIALTEAAPLIDRLSKLQLTEATALMKVISAIPEVHTVMDERAKRIAISGAPVLDDMMIVTDMKARLDQHFPSGKELYPFQYVGVQFAQLSFGRALIADDMGIGKTIQALAYIALNQDKFPALVVCPANVKYNWASVAVIEGRSKGEIPEADIIICNYDIMSGRANDLLDMKINIVVCDESHYLKNHKAKRTEATLNVAKGSASVLCLSGTAITNRPNEFNSFFNFGKRYCDGQQTRFGWDFTGSSNTEELHERTRDFTIRRLKKEVLAELPDKVRTIHTVKPSKSQLTKYHAKHESWLADYQHYIDNNTMPAGFILNVVG